MNISIISSTFNVDTGNFSLKGQFHKNFKNTYFYMEMQNSYNLSPHLAYEITKINEKREFEINFNVKELLAYPFFNNAYWTCYFLCDNTKIAINTKKNYNKYIFHSNSFFYVTPVQKETLIFMVNSKPINAKLNHIDFIDDNLILEIKTPHLNLKSGEKPFISIKCREQKRFFKYYKSIDIPLKKSYKNNQYLNYCLKESLSIFLPYLNFYEYFDIFFEIKNNCGIKSVPLIKGKKSLNNIFCSEIDCFHKIKPTTTTENQISLVVNSYLTFKLSNFNLNKGQIIFDGYLSKKKSNKSINNNIQSCQLILKNKTRVFEKFEYLAEINFPLKLQENYLNAVIDLKNFEKFIKVDNSYDLFIRLIINDFSMDIPLKAIQKMETSCIFNDLLIKLKLDKSMNCSLYAITYQTKHKIIKIGVLGSCFSRTAFNSMEYFNPDYKKFYNCTFSQLYHSSIPALASKPLKPDFLENLLKKIDEQNVNSENKNFLMVDVKKSFFQEIKKIEIDYLIIDLYSDAVKNLIRFPDESYIGTFHLDVNKLFPELKYEVISPLDNNEVFFELFKKGVDKFAERILEIIPEENIILNKGNFAYKWQNKKGQIVEYEKNQIKSYKEINYVWDKLNNYFLKKLPKVKIIDMRDTNYIPHYDFPFNSAAMHYESDYYKEFLNRLNKIVLEDKLKQLTINKGNNNPYSNRTLKFTNVKELEGNNKQKKVNKYIKKINKLPNEIKNITSPSTDLYKLNIIKLFFSKFPYIHILINMNKTGIKNALINIMGYKAIKKNALFDKTYYLKENEDVKTSGMDPILHYMFHGFEEGRNPNPYFNGDSYLEANKDIKKSNINPLVHYSLYGLNEGRKIKEA